MKPQTLIGIAFSLISIFQISYGQSTNQPPPAAPCTQPATTRPVYLLNPPPGTVIQNLDINCIPPGTQQAGAGGNNTNNLTIQYCRINGFDMGVMCTGYNPGLHVRYCVIVNSTPDPASWTSTGSVDAHGMYVEGGDGIEIDHCIILDCGWWPTADFTQLTTRSTMSRHHGIYLNESHGTTDNKRIHDCIILNSAGSQVGCRLGGTVYANVYGSGFDWDVVVGGYGGVGPSTPYGKLAQVYGNVTFGPRLNQNPYYGGGFSLDPAGMGRPGSVGVIEGNTGMSAQTISPHAIALDAQGNVIQQMGWWATGGAVVPGAGQHVWTLADYYGNPNFYALMKCDDAPKIRAWLYTKISTSAPLLGTGTTVTGQQFNVVAK